MGAIVLSALVTVTACGSSQQVDGVSTAAPAPATSSSALPTSPTATATPVPTSAEEPTSTAPQPAPSTVDLLNQDQVERKLASLTQGAGRTVVRVPSGYDAMVTGRDDATGTVTFWHYGTSWTKVGASTYPYDPSMTTQPLQGPPRGAVLDGMEHPIFILEGAFSGDSTANAVGYTDGPDGWGVIKARPDGNLASSGQGVSFGGIGLENDAYFSDGLYETAECSTTLAFAQCSGDQRVLKYWAWNGAELVLARTGGLPR